MSVSILNNTPNKTNNILFSLPARNNNALIGTLSRKIIIIGLSYIAANLINFLNY